MSKLLWVTIIIIFGTYIRNRDGHDLTDADWLIFFQILVCFFAGLLGVFKISSADKPGFGGKIFLFYCFSAIVSVAFSSYPKIVIGYWGLYIGVGFLILGMVLQSSSVDDLIVIEKLWLATVTIILIKDTVIGFFFHKAVDWVMPGEPFRLGMELVHANKMSLMASIAFLITFQIPNTARLLVWFVRLLFLSVILFSRTRSSLACLLVGLSIISVIWFYRNSINIRKNSIIFGAPCIFFCCLGFFALGLSFEFSFLSGFFEFLNRGQDLRAISSFTGRTEIWNFVLKQIFKSAETFLFGHGYGTTRLVINEHVNLSFIATHSHNTILESMFTVGIVGTFPLFLMFAYGFIWVFVAIKAKNEQIINFSIRAFSVSTIISINSLTESFIAIKVNPIVFIFIFYIFSLDRIWIFKKFD